MNKLALMMYTDEELLRLMDSDSQEAFSILYHRYWEELFTTAARALRGKEEAADVVQDVFLSLWNRRRDLNILGSIPAYLNTSVRYKCFHYIEKNITRRDYILKLAEVATNSTPATCEINLQVKEMTNVINKVVDDMPAKMQEAYNLSRLGHLSHKEIARQMDISVETVKKHIQRALQLIRRALLPHTFLSFLLIYF